MALYEDTVSIDVLVHIVRLGTSPSGPPESMREHVVAAAHAMGKGNWKACCDYITSIKVLILFELSHD